MTLLRPSRGGIGSPYGMRDGTMHYGTDFGWGNGSDVYAAADGEVIHAGPGGGYGARYGTLIIIDHGGGVQTRYAHLSKLHVSKGQQVRGGQLVGIKGGSGADGPNSYAVHLHFEVRINGEFKNPEHYLVSTAPAGGGTPITPAKKRKKSMSTLYQKQHSKPALFALAGESPGTSANWLETTDQAFANQLAEIHGNARLLSASTWDSWRVRYLEPLSVKGGTSSGGGGGATAAQVADELAARLKS